MAYEEDVARTASSTGAGDGTWTADAVGPSIPTGEPEPVAAEDPDAGSRRFWAIVVAVLVLLLLLTLCLLAFCTLRPDARGKDTAAIAVDTTPTPTPAASAIRGRADAEEALLALERCRDAARDGATLPELEELAKEAQAKVQAFQGSQDAVDNPNLTNDMVKAAALWQSSCDSWSTANVQAVASYNGAHAVWVKAGRPGKTPTIRDYFFTGAYRSIQAQAAAVTEEARWLLNVPRDLDPPQNYSP